MSQIILAFPVRATDGNGAPVPGAQLRFTLAGTTTTATVYADAAETVPLSQPIVANSAGLWPPVYRSGALLRALGTTPGGATLPGFPIDPVASTFAGSAASSISFQATVAIPETNVQAAIERVQANALAPLLDGGIGVSGSAPLLASFDATNIPSGFYRFDTETAGERPEGFADTSGVTWLFRENTINAVQWARRRLSDRAYSRRLVAGEWEPWQQTALIGTGSNDVRRNADLDERYRPLDWPASFQELTSSDVWEKPVGAAVVYVEAIGGGCSGQARIGASSTLIAEGGGGGIWISGVFRAQDLPATVNVVVGAGGPSVTQVGAGAAVNLGGSSSFHTLVAPGGSLSEDFSGAYQGGRFFGPVIKGGATAGQTSLEGGDGGVNVRITATNVDVDNSVAAGQAPGGGGGGVAIRQNTSSLRTAITGAGADGRVRIWVW